ncbi:hypothetical protein [Streptomyces sp. 11x1]|uniref:hypothetical protein n=1 Tax=Streptomyces sp. 11x1 TaxID=3038642 RepID=UPI00292DC509|nr:hypothetical protein [Streptomyces sp. 11x1]WNZ07858.1 hypothetical protein P8T65_09855 [Streptomyces sp. 11x1]
MRFRWLVVTAGLAAALGTTLAAPSASAATNCRRHEDCIRWWCNNVSGAPVYGSVGSNRLYPNPNQAVGTMNTNPSWFYCKLDNQAWAGGPHPTRWLRTVTDNGQPGWMKDTAIYSETNPLRDC